MWDEYLEHDSQSVLKKLGRFEPDDSYKLYPDNKGFKGFLQCKNNDFIELYERKIKSKKPYYFITSIKTF